MFVKELTKAEYAKYLESYPDATVFHGIEWINIVSKTYKLNVKYLGFFENENVVVGVLPLFVRRFYGVKLFGAPLPQTGTPTLFPLFLVDESSAALLALTEWVKTRRISHLQICWKDPALVVPKGAYVEVRETLTISISNTLGELWKNFTATARNRLRKAVRSGVKVHWMTRAEFLDEYYELLESTYRRQGLQPNFPRALYKALIETCLGRNLRILAATLNGQRISAVWILFDKQNCYFWDGASRQEHKKLAASNLLQWEVIRWGSKNRLKTYNLIGGLTTSGRGGNRIGIGRFKRSLGGSPTEYAVVYWQQKWIYPAFRFYRFLLRARNRPSKRTNGKVPT